MMTRPASSSGGATRASGSSSRARRRASAAPSRPSEGIAIIDNATATSRIAASARSTTPPATAAAIMTKANSPPGPSSSAASPATRPGAPNSRAEREHDQRLDRDQRDGDPDRHDGRGGQDRQVELGADRDEEQAEQQALERLDGDFDLAADIRSRRAAGRRRRRPAPSTARWRRRSAPRPAPPAGRPP